MSKHSYPSDFDDDFAATSSPNDSTMMTSSAAVVAAHGVDPTQRTPFWTAMRSKVCSSLKKNLVPGLILNGIGVFIVILFYSSPAVAEFMESIGEIKDEYGFGYSFLATAIFGGFIPYVIMIFMDQDNHLNLYWISTRFVFFIVFWGYRGVEVSCLFIATIVITIFI